MANANVVGLQNAINRIAGLGGFARVSIDGAVGPKTAQGLLQALQWINQNAATNEDQSAAAGLVAAIINNDGSINTGQITSSASGFTTFLNKIGDAMGAPPENVAASGGGGSSSGGGAVMPVPSSVAPAWAANIMDAFNKLPSWQKAALGVGTAVAAIAIVSKVRKHRRSHA